MADQPEITRRAAAADHLVALPAGTMLGKYRLETVLGQGGFGITYRAVDLELDRPVAIKEYLPSDVAVRVDGTTVKARSRNDEESFAWGLARFLDEAKALARFAKVPGIVRVYDYLQANGTAYMIMELVDGAPLSEIYRRQGALTEEKLKPMALALLDGLAPVHASGFLHRDIKPANILIGADGAPVLIDFGAARQALGEKSRSITGIYTPGYAPFEQYMSEGKQGPWTDIYALAATLYQGVTGRAPPQATDRMLQDDMIPAARAGAGRSGNAFLDAIDRALAVHPKDRPQNVAQWRAMLQSGAKLAPQAAAATPRRRVGLVVGGIALGIAALGGAGWVIFGRGAPGSGDLQSELAATELRLRQLTEEARKAADDARKRSEGAQAALDGEMRRRSEQEARLKAEEDERRQQEQARRAAEEEARRQAADAQRKAEEARQSADEEARRKAEAEAKRLAELEAQRRAEDAAREKADAEARQAAEEARQRADAELAESRRQAEAAQKEAEQRQRQAEQAKQAAEAEAQRLAVAEAKRKADEETRKKSEAEAKAKVEQEAKAKAEADAKKKAEDDAKKKVEAEAKKKAEEEAKKKAEADAKKKADDQAKVANAPPAQQATTEPPKPAGYAFEGLWSWRFNCPPFFFAYGGSERISGPNFSWSFKRQASGTATGKIDGTRLEFRLRWQDDTGAEFDSQFILNQLTGADIFLGEGVVSNRQNRVTNCPITFTRVGR